MPKSVRKIGRYRNHTRQPGKTVWRCCQLLGSFDHFDRFVGPQQTVKEKHLTSYRATSRNGPVTFAPQTSKCASPHQFFKIFAQSSASWFPPKNVYLQMLRFLALTEESKHEESRSSTMPTRWSNRGYPFWRDNLGLRSDRKARRVCVTPTGRPR